MARRLQRVGPRDSEAAAREWLAFWHGEERLHIEVEEAVLVPALDAHGAEHHPAVTRMLVEHVLIRAQTEQLGAAVGEHSTREEALQRLGRRLAGHVRHEERVLFPLVERTLPLEALEAVGRAIQQSARLR